MNPLSTLTLSTPNGIFVFDAAEVPEKITFGGDHLLDTEKMIGGRRRINVMGADDDPLGWTGIFLYTSALSRARFLDSVRRQGLTCTLSWDALLYQVVIKQFRADYEKPFKIPYSIVFEIIQDLTSTVDSVPAVTPAQALNTDMARIGTLSNCIGDPTLNSLTGTLQSAISSISSAAQPIANGLKAVTSFVSGVANCADQIVNEVASAAASVTAPLAAVGVHVQALITGAEGTLAAGTGVLPGAAVAQTVLKVAAATTSCNQLPELYELRSIVARMQVNLPLVSTPTSAQTITVGGGDCYTIAAQQYGDASRFTDILAANPQLGGDPVLTGINTLTIPA